MVRKIFTAIAVLALALSGLLTSSSVASAAPCGGVYSLGVGGVSQGNSALFFNVSQRVGYSAVPFSWSVQEGTNELNRLFNDQRRLCPGQHVRAIGHSLGAAVVHNWLTQVNPVNVDAVLIADPKRPAGPGSGGVGNQIGFLGYPLAGTDNFYGRTPVLQVCHPMDGVCNSEAGFFGYLTGVHASYDYDVNHYAGVGTIFN